MLGRLAPGVAGLAALSVAASVAGCGSSASSLTSGSSRSTVRLASSSRGFPMTVRSPAGTAVIKRAPRRIVSLSPTTTEDLFAIGAGPQVAAVDSYSDYPRSAPRTKLSGFEPNVEAIANYRPDLVVISDESPSGLARSLRTLAIPVVEDPAPRTLAQAYAQIDDLGAATGHVAQARAVVAGMKTRIAALVRGTHGWGRSLTVYDELTTNLYAASSRTFVGQLLTMFGLRDIADRAPDPQGLGYPKLSAEHIVASNPAIVLLSDTICCGQSAATVARRPGWSRMRAVRDHTVVGLNDDIASRWAPRTVELAAAIARAIGLAHAAGLRA